MKVSLLKKKNKSNSRTDYQTVPAKKKIKNIAMRFNLRRNIKIIKDKRHQSNKPNRQKDLSRKRLLKQSTLRNRNKILLVRGKNSKHIKRRLLLRRIVNKIIIHLWMI